MESLDNDYLGRCIMEDDSEEDQNRSWKIYKQNEKEDYLSVLRRETEAYAPSVEVKNDSEMTKTQKTQP